MPDKLGPDHWRHRAAMMIEDAEKVTDEGFKHSLLNMAAVFQAMARLSEKTHGESDRIKGPDSL